MKNLITAVACILLATCIAIQARAQGIHFSQYYHAPMLLNPANTALSSDKDFSAGANYRIQWAALPMSYTTYSAYGDGQISRNKTYGKSWLGFGGAAFRDDVGGGAMTLMRGEAFLAYHLSLGEWSMISGGASVAYCQRSLDFNRLSFDSQWDGITFSNGVPSGESGGIQKTSYTDLSAGLNYAYLPSEYLYMKLGVGVAHINSPEESYYGIAYHVHPRPTANLDVLYQVSEGLTINPSAYFTSQGSAWELMYGSLLQIKLREDYKKNSSEQLLLGLYHRLGDALVLAAGYELSNGLRVLANCDYNISTLSQQVKNNTSFEIALRFQGIYSDRTKSRGKLACPRF